VDTRAQERELDEVAAALDKSTAADSQTRYFALASGCGNWRWPNRCQVRQAAVHQAVHAGNVSIICLNHMPWVSRPGGDICILPR